MDTNATFPQAAHILNLIGEKGVSKEQLNGLIKSGLLADLLDADPTKVDRNDFRKLLKLTPQEFKILVDYTRTLEEMIAAGHYDWTNADITEERFPVKGDGHQKLTAELVHFKRDMSTDDVLAELKNRDLHPATIAELLAFGEKYPDIQRKFLIVGLGSSVEVNGKRVVPCLNGNDSKRSLDLGWCGNGWGSYFRFLTFRN